MIITVIGWYGTETIGDRAILAGLISFFNKAYGDFEIRLGSLHPFFTQRTVNEDYSYYKEIINKDFKIEIFNSTNNKELVASIKDSDIVVMGGGPLMDLYELYMVEYAFKKSRKLGIKTAILGCGVGPLFHKKFRKSVLNIVLNSDLVILRDEISKDNLKEIYQEFATSFSDDLISTNYDPAVECALQYNKLSEKSNQNYEYIAVNLRDFPHEYSKENIGADINAQLMIFIKELSLKYKDKEIRLIPMHYFHIGGDDRVFLNKIALELNMSNIQVQNISLTLKETMEIFKSSIFSIGMRFHSVILQTIISRKNYVLDYTEPNKGKISGFLNDIDENNFFSERYIALQRDNISLGMIKETEKKIVISNKINDKLDIYISKLIDN
jgi:polysaccharide pyruvyl transferase WcaK-like protein